MLFYDLNVSNCTKKLVSYDKNHSNCYDGNYSIEKNLYSLKSFGSLCLLVSTYKIMIRGNINRMLLVEDDPNDIELIQLALEDYHFANEMDIVEDGEQALQYLFGRGENTVRRQLPQFVLLDLKLPKINGLKVLEEIRSNPLTQKIVVVVMTSSREDRDLKACYNLGVNSYIVKPFCSEEFREIAQKVGSYWMIVNQPPLPSPLS